MVVSHALVMLTCCDRGRPVSHLDPDSLGHKAMMTTSKSVYISARYARLSARRSVLHMMTSEVGRQDSVGARLLDDHDCCWPSQTMAGAECTVIGTYGKQRSLLKKMCNHPNNEWVDWVDGNGGRKGATRANPYIKVGKERSPPY